MENKPYPHNTTTSPSPIKQHLSRHWLPYLIAGLFLLGLLYMIYRNYQLNQKWGQERKAVAEQVRTGQIENDRHQLTIALKSLGWAVQNTMLRNPSANITQTEVNQYFSSLIREKGVRELLLVDSKGTVVLFTNKKNQGVALADRYPAALIQQQEAYFQDAGSFYQLSVPIMSLDNRLGTVVMIYRPNVLVPEQSNR